MVATAMIGARGAVVAVFEELGHGVDAGPEEIRQEPEGDDDQGDGRHPFVAGDGEADVTGRVAAHADELLGRDVGGDEREADQPPVEAAAGQEVILAAFSLLLLMRPTATTVITKAMKTMTSSGRMRNTSEEFIWAG